MEKTMITDDKGRHYSAWKDGDAHIVIGPPEGLVDSLELPEPFATRLHNALHARSLLNYEQISKNPKSLLGALQEALQLDLQRLTEAYFKFSQEVSHE